MREKIISLELTKSDDLDQFAMNINGNGTNGNGTKSEDGDAEETASETISEPVTPIIEEENSLDDFASLTSKQKKRRKRTKKGKTT